MPEFRRVLLDRKSTRLNSSHTIISYAVFCLKKKRLHSGLAGRGLRGRPGRPSRLAGSARARAAVLVVRQSWWGIRSPRVGILFFFLNDTAPPEISPFPLPAPLPI